MNYGNNKMLFSDITNIEEKLWKNFYKVKMLKSVMKSRKCKICVKKGRLTNFFKVLNL